MNKSFKSIDISFDTNDQSSFFYDTFTKTHQKLNPRKQLEITSWLQTKEISFPIELIPQKFSNGAFFCDLINKSLKRQLKFYKSPTTPAEKKFNIRKALGYLRTLKDLKSDYLWNEEDVYHCNAQIIWVLLEDLKKYFEEKQSKSFHMNDVKRSNSSFKRTASISHEEDQEQLLKDLVFKVRPWLQQLGLDGLLRRETNYIKDPVRNGCLLCSILELIVGSVDFCEDPQNTEEVYSNIEVAVNGIGAMVPLKKMEYYLYTEPFEVWNLLHTLMVFYHDLTAKKPKPGWPYSEDKSHLLKESLLSWVLRLGVIEDLKDFPHLCSYLRTGELLSKIVRKVVGKEVLGILPNPKTPKVCMSNIEKCFKVLAIDRKMSQEYVRNPEKVAEGDPKFIMLLLEDLHRAHAGLATRKRGKSYHQDGPFIVHNTRSCLTPQRSYSNLSYRSFDQRPNKNTDNQESFIKKLITNTRSALDFYGSNQEISPLSKENLGEFGWIRRIGVKLPGNLDMTGEKIEVLADGTTFCAVLSLLEYKDIEGVQKCKHGTPAARRNIKMALGVLKQKPSLASKVLYIEDKVFAADGEAIRLVLKEIYRLYRNTIFTLMRFNRKNRNSSFV